VKNVEYWEGNFLFVFERMKHDKFPVGNVSMLYNIGFFLFSDGMEF
jgi:hypothetical protein